MKKRIIALSLILTITVTSLFSQTTNDSVKKEKILENLQLIHPWYGKKVGYLGDSMTDPNGYKEIKKYWSFLQDWLNITPLVYGVNGRQWNDIPRQAQKLKDEHGDDVDAILVFIGTNDFNAGIPVGDWFTVQDDSVMAARGHMQEMTVRKKRYPIFDKDTYRGRINTGIQSLKSLFPDKQIILLTPLHRSTAAFNEKNVQPDESYQNLCGEFIDAYIESIKEAGNLWGLPVIDINSVSGMNPMFEDQLPYFRNPRMDRLHMSSKGQARMAMTLIYQLLAFPCVF